MSNHKTRYYLLIFLQSVLHFINAQSWKEFASEAKKAMDDADYPRAVELQEKVVKHVVAEFGKEHENYFETLYNLADYYLYNYDLELAEQTGIKTRDLAIKLYGKEHLKYAKSLDILGLVYTFNFKNDLAEKCFKEAIVLIKKLKGVENEQYADIITGLALLYHGSGNYEECESLNKEGLKIYGKVLGENSVKYAEILNNLASLYFDLLLPEKALPLQLKAAEYYRKKYGEKHVEYAFIINTLARIYAALGNYAKAELLHKNAYHTVKAKLGVDSYDISIIAGDIANLMSQKKKIKEAEKYYLQALGLIKKYEGENTFYYNLTLNALADLYKNAGDFNNAEKILLRMLNTEDYDKIVNQSNYLSLISSIGDLYFEYNHINKAEEYYQKAIDLRKKIDSKGKANPYSLFRNLARLHLKKYEEEGYYKENNLTKALSYCEKSVSENVINYPLFLNGELQNNYKNNKNLIKSLLLKSEILEKISIQEEYNIIPLREAYQAISKCDQLIDISKHHFKSLDDKLYFNNTVSEVYQQAVKVTYKLYILSNDDFYKEKAFYFSELNKSSVLSQAIQNHYAIKFTGIPDSLINREKALKVYLNSYKEKILKLKDENNVNEKDKLLEYQNRFLSLSEEHDSLIAYFENQNPNYFQLKYKKQNTSIDKIQNSLQENTTLLEYFIADSSVYAFSITKDNFNLSRFSFNKDISNKVIGLMTLLKEKDETSFNKSSHLIYNQIVKPLNISTENVIIIPDGILWQINFDLLVKDKSDVSDYRDLNFLIKDHSIIYNYSANLFINGIQNKNKPTLNQCLAFSYNNEDNQIEGRQIAMRGVRNSKMIDLPGSRKEIKAISTVVEGKYYYGKFANEKNFKENAKDYRILHLALHGVIDDTDPMNSKLYFTQSEDSQNKDNSEDNYLHAYELYNMDLNTDLAVLSACNTASGKIIKGEGVMNLGRAFSYAGCKSLMISQWEVSDDFTPDLMKDFYKGLKEGENKATALRNAKLAYLSNADNLSANPYFWAPLVLIGDNSSLDLKDTNYLFWGSIVVSFLILIVIVSFKMKSN